jgi:energy-coupling factor transporter ATP-binding protein EcfA2
VPEDRKARLPLEFRSPRTSPARSQARARRHHQASETATAERQRRSLDIRTPSVANEAAALSGGNQQKVVLAKWLSMQPAVMIFDEPTRGIDVGAKSEIYALMRALADGGVAILMISSDMEEVIGVSDRVAVMCEGAISGFLERTRFSEQNILQLAVGNRTYRELRTAMFKRPRPPPPHPGRRRRRRGHQSALPVADQPATRQPDRLFGAVLLARPSSSSRRHRAVRRLDHRALGVIFVDLIANVGLPWGWRC